MGDNAQAELDQFTKTISVKSPETGMFYSHQVAGVGARSLAGLLDVCIQFVTFLGMAWLAVSYRPDLFPRDAWFWAVPVAFAEWHIIYLMLFESFTWGLTPGKAGLGLQVIGTDGLRPMPRQLVIRNVTRVFELIFGCYMGACYTIGSSVYRQRLGDRYAGTAVIYSISLGEQLYQAEVPESLYSTSEDGYLLQSWIEREPRMNAESQSASAIDLASYLHAKYDGSSIDLVDPVLYLRELNKAETQHPHEQNATPGNENASAVTGR